MAGFLDERVAGVVVREAVEQPALFHDGGEGLGFREVESGGLVREDVKAVFERHFRRGKVHVIRRDDGDEVHALGGRAGFLGGDHFLESAVAAVGGQEEIRAGLAGALWVGTKSAANKFNLAVNGGGDAVNGSDESAASAADHAHANFSAHKDEG